METSEINNSNISIDPEWAEILDQEFKKPYFEQLKTFIRLEKKQFTIYPPGPEIFSAFNHTPFSQVKVVLIGQDPYHGPRQANGLCFSVTRGILPPPSLKNIFKELNNDLGIPIPQHGDLSSWADQGVLMLNATLTVRAGEAGSHQNNGWEIFTDEVIRILSKKKQGLIFLLWGRYAHSKESLIDATKHFILKAAHPSPLARGAFFGSKHFSKTNEILKNKGEKEIDWKLP